MRFAETNSDIPEDLIDASLAGELVFLCGAGVSKRVGLPLFNELTDQIYELLGETFSDDAPEREPYHKQEFDRTLGALEKRIRMPGNMSSPVRIACARLLVSPANPDLSDCQAILTLSRDREGHSRVLTTNFDTLFERAAAKRGIHISSHAMKSLPKPGSYQDRGVHHLHGRIADLDLGLPETDLILTSADFGDAYLRDGWASRYIEDRMRTATLVLIGYRAEDAALRLLLEALDVDRARFGDLRKVYALEQAKKDSSAQWRSKGIIPIEFDSRDGIYQSLREWARYIERPMEYEQERVRDIFKKPAASVSEFEKSQLLSLMTRGNAALLLLQENPPLTWLPVLADLHLVQNDQRGLASWIGKNLHDPQGVKEVVARLPLFGRGVSELLQFGLNQNAAALPPFLLTAWRLVVRHMESATDPALNFGWFDLLPSLQRGDRSANVIGRLATLLQPKLRVSRPFRLYDDDGAPVSKFQDLLRVEYETDEHVSIEEVLEAWGTDNPSETNGELLVALSHALDSVLADATDLGLETAEGFGVTDANVASVANHPQNRYRAGFLCIVRVMAEIVTSLIAQAPGRARRHVLDWIGSKYRINHRLALFAVSDAHVGKELVTEVLLALPAAELFLGGGTVEVHRLLATRWNDLSDETRAILEERIRCGPPSSWFQPGADVSRYIDRTRFDLIGDLIRHGILLSSETQALFKEIQARWPEWLLRASERAGFHSWHSSGREAMVEGNDNEVKNGLTLEGGDLSKQKNWRHLCDLNPSVAFEELCAQGEADRWRPAPWREFLISDKVLEEPELVRHIARMLMALPADADPEIIALATRWFGKAEILSLDEYRWPLFDTIFDATLHCEQDSVDDGTAFERAWVSPVGEIVDVLLRMITSSEEDATFQEAEPRLDKILSSAGKGGRVARMRLASELNFLYDRAPAWTTEKLLPGFDWKSPDAADFWAARHYSASIGGAQLFLLTKRGFLELFGHRDMSQDIQNVYAGWLFSILVANRTSNAGYDLSYREARAALRKTNPMVLQALAHDVVARMQQIDVGRKRQYWCDVLGPVFEGLWPMDVEMLSGRLTFKLIQILRASGDAFPFAADAILPFIRPEEREQGTAIYSLGKADDVIFNSAPEKLLNVVAAAAGEKEKGSIYGLRAVLERIAGADPTLVNGRIFQRLLQMARIEQAQS